MSFFQIDIAEIVIHEADQPDAVVDFLNADGLTGQGDAQIDLFAIKAEPAAAGDVHRSVVERVMRLRNAFARADREENIDFRRALSRPEPREVAPD